ncbi:hypothetical protein [Enterovibrio norvegicus]|uniref:hypothetical protein n=1 Tax=Enterovibrio norvegicus TaxID=188144 RepID=UPI000C81EBDE|nr:hypothetical protein [Enterovibrio norvegicus]PMN64285.1 hypothetical protein BCT27_09990 [Enterovibrio norvegicus]
MFSFLISSQPEQRDSCIDQNQPLSSLSFYDATTTNRIGFRGEHTASFLTDHHIALPSKPNQATEMDNGLWVLRLGFTEYWIIDVKNQHTDLMLSMEKSATSHQQVTRLYCQHSSAMFVLTGDKCPQLFAKVCAVDLQPDAFSSGHIAQTSVARVSSVVVNASNTDLKQTRFLILSDISSAAYLWDALDDAAHEFQ